MNCTCFYNSSVTKGVTNMLGKMLFNMLTWTTFIGSLLIWTDDIVWYQRWQYVRHLHIVLYFIGSRQFCHGKLLMTDVDLADEVYAQQW